jgi:hypothetical protein
MPDAVSRWMNDCVRALRTASATVILSVTAGCGPSLTRPTMTAAPVSAFV